MTKKMLYPVERKVFLNAVNDQLIDLDTESLGLLGSEQQITGLQLTVKVGSKTYQQIIQDHLFHITPELLYPWDDAANLVASELVVKITLLLSPVLLKSLIKQDDEPQQVFNRFWEWYDKKNVPEIRLTESWFGLQIVQGDKAVTYRTLWDFWDWSDVFMGAYFQEASLPSVVKFLSFWESNQSKNTDSEKPLILREKASKIIDVLTKFKPDISPEDIDDLDILNLLGKTIDSVNVILNHLVQNLPEISKDTSQYLSGYQGIEKPAHKSLMELVILFLQQEDINFLQINPEEPILFFKMKGKNKDWICQAKVREEEQQLIFYSILTAQTPNSKIPLVAEFISRSNYGLFIGNFEIDWSDGEIRYKTSIDVEGSSLNLSQIHSLVYTNIEMMDKYLPGITMVIENKMSPEEAVRQIERQ